jgi:hypothetical protein
MKARVANMFICRHFDKWVESIEDAAVKVDETYLMDLIDRIV